MDLDKLKSNWNDLDKKEQTTAIRDENILALLKDKGKGAINSMKKWAIFEFVFGIVFLVAAPFILCYAELNEIYKLIMYVLLVFVVFALPWEYFKVYTLRKTDIVSQSFLDVSKKMAFFRKLISYEIIFAIIFLIVFDIAFFYIASSHLVVPTWLFITMIITVVATQSILIAVLYRLFYWKSIKKMKEILKEIEQFENEDIN